MRLVKLLESPDQFKVGSTSVKFNLGTAFSFVTPNILAITHNTHPSIFGATRAYAGRGVGIQSDKVGKYGVFRDYGVTFLGGKPSHEELISFSNKLVGEMGQSRRNTQSGRVWIGIKDSDLGTFNGVSFWIDNTDLMEHPDAASTVACSTSRVSPTLRPSTTRHPRFMGTSRSSRPWLVG